LSVIQHARIILLVVGRGNSRTTNIALDIHSFDSCDSWSNHLSMAPGRVCRRETQRVVDHESHESYESRREGRKRLSVIQHARIILLVVGRSNSRTTNIALDIHSFDSCDSWSNHLSMALDRVCSRETQRVVDHESHESHESRREGRKLLSVIQHARGVLLAVGRGHSRNTITTPCIYSSDSW
jgi:hypothetical protein